MSNLRQLDDNDLEDGILQTDQPLLVDFWADWCGPCRAVAPTLEELGQDYQGRATIAKLNVDENPESALRYSVRSIPTMILFKNGEEKERLVGAQAKKIIAAMLDRHAA